MKLLLFIALAGASAYTLPAQQLERMVTASSGSYQSHPTVGNLHWTMGELAVATFQNEYVLSQGFQQGYPIDIISAIGDVKSEMLTVKIFPNPSSRWIQVEADVPGSLELILTDLLGHQLFAPMAAPASGIIDLQPLLPGVYVLRVSRKGQLIGAFRIQKADD